MIFKEKYMMFCFFILTLMLLNLEDKNYYSKTRKWSHHSQLKLICYLKFWVLHKLGFVNLYWIIPPNYTLEIKEL